MCGIVGLFFKRGGATASLGPLLAGMLSQMRERGPDSTGFALYGEDAPQGAFKATLRAPADEYDRQAFEGEFGAVVPPGSAFSALASASRCSRMSACRTRWHGASISRIGRARTASVIRGWRRK